MNLYFLYLVFFYFIKKCFNYIVYPLKAFYESDKIENLLLFNSTYTTIEMGTPPQKVNFYFSLNHSKMFITDVGCQNTVYLVYLRAHQYLYWETQMKMTHIVP